MKKSIIIISLVINFLLVLGTLSSFSQNSLSPKDHPYGLFAERRISQFANFPVTQDSTVFLGDSFIDEGRWEEFFLNLKINSELMALAEESGYTYIDLYPTILGAGDYINCPVAARRYDKYIEKSQI